MNDPQRILKENKLGLEFRSNNYYNELGTLYNLYAGISFLNNQLVHLQDCAKKSKNSNFICGFFSDLEGTFELPPGSNALLPSFHHWFGVSVVNFVRLVGLLKGMELKELPSSIPQDSN